MSTQQSAHFLDAPFFDGHLIRPGDKDYDQYRKVWNGLFDRRPALILRARSSDDVRACIRLAADRGLALAVRCGGHSLPGFSTCDEGMVLDLSLMNHIRINPIDRTAEVGGGALLGDLDKAASPYGLVTPAGVVSHTGIAGLTLGGGMGWLSRRFGLTIDSLIAAEICLADGTMLTASPENEPDLFWGLRGGGGNFGVVTKFFFRMHALGNVLVGRWEYPMQHMRAALDAYGALAGAAPRHLTSSFAATRNKLTVTAFWSGDLAGAEAAIAAFGRLAPGACGTIGGTTFLQLQSRNDELVAWGRRYYAKGGFLEVLTEPAIGSMCSGGAEAPTADSEIYVLQLGGAACDIGEDDTAYSGRSAAFYWIAMPVWDDPVDDARCLAWGRATARRLAESSSSRNYVNEQADPGIAQQAYGAEKYRRLVKLKTRFDPTNLFRLNQNIAPQE
ncbi:FAD-binding oxidoreductase [Taklimakanibacter deserti]|uniref:FAD-binding oxidoreductase n=1 Tax=Taklimakanibacter deserti TaxID=2267839 RepID=UPI000E65D678